MKFNIYSLLAPFNLSPGTPTPQNREPRPVAEEPALPEIDYSLLATIARSKDETRRAVDTPFKTAASVNV
jgi:hypothetical protein